MKPEAQEKNLKLIFSQADYVGVSWAARAIGVSRVTIVKLIEEGKLTGHRQSLSENGWWRIRKDSVIAYLEQIRKAEFGDDFTATEVLK